MVAIVRTRAIDTRSSHDVARVDAYQEEDLERLFDWSESADEAAHRRPEATTPELQFLTYKGFELLLQIISCVARCLDVIQHYRISDLKFFNGCLDVDVFVFKV